MNDQIFRFCCSCIEVVLIKDKKCYKCNGKFLLYGIKDNYVFYKQNEKTH